jgi:hypothetical protein
LTSPTATPCAKPPTRTSSDQNNCSSKQVKKKYNGINSTINISSGSD